MKFAKLIDEQGNQLANPAPTPGSVSWDSRNGVAHAWAEDGKTMIAEMHGARVVWIGATGIRIEGHELNPKNMRLRLMQWQVIF